jgi:uncharacterized membrane protein (UPF0127 family)
MSRGTILVDKGRVADSFWSRLKGLIGVRDLAEGDGLLIQGSKGVHCMFMSIPIDVLYVDNEDRIIAVDQAMKPWAVGRIRPASRYVIELPAGTAARTGTTVGDRLQVKQL